MLTEGLGRILAEFIHDLRNLPGTIDSLQGDGILGFLIVAVFLIGIKHHIPQGLAMLLAVCGHFAQTHHGNNGILVPGMGSGQTSIAFLQTKHIIVASAGLEQLNLLANILKAREHLYQLHIIIPRDGPGHICGHNGSHQGGIFRHGPGCGSLPENILRDQHTRHIAGKGHILPGCGILCINAQTVRVGIRCQHNIRIFFLCQPERIGKCLGILRIGIIQRGKIGIGILLLGNHINMLKAKFR